MAFATIKEVFDHHVTAKIDKNFAIAMIIAWQKFISRSESHSLFFNSPYVGVYPIRYMTSDANNFLEDILGIEDIAECQEDIYSVPEVDRNHHVASDVVNLAYIYANHRLMQAPIPNDLKQNALEHTIAMAITKHLCSQITRRFKFNADIAIAAQLFELLDNKTDLKKFGDWKNLLLERGRQFNDPREGIHYKSVLDFTDNKRVIYATGDIQDRIVGVLNLLTEKFHEIKATQGRVLSQSTISSIDGEKVLREFARKETQLIREMQEICQSQRDLIKEDLLEFTVGILTTADTVNLAKVLEYYVDNFNVKELGHDTAIEKLIVYIFHEAKTANLDVSNIPALIGRIKSIFKHSNTKKADVLELKRLFNEITESAIPRARDSIKVSITLAVVIYLALRTLSINYYR
jgi:hypothetical protein